jgi:hypothetical protein
MNSGYNTKLGKQGEKNLNESYKQVKFYFY